MNGRIVQHDGGGLAPIGVEAIQLLDEVEHEEGQRVVLALIDGEKWPFPCWKWPRSSISDGASVRLK